MPFINFFGQNIHFAISLLAGLVFFAVFWLYFDSWLNKRHLLEIFEWSGFLILSLSFIVYATVTEQSILGQSLLGNFSANISLILGIIGFACIIVGQLVIPLQAKPEIKGLEDDFEADSKKADEPKNSETTKKTAASAIGLGSIGNLSHLFLPLGALVVAGLYWRRATTGLERHLKPVAYAFIFIFAYELLSLESLWQNSSNPSVAKFTASFGTLWFINQALLLIGVVILGRWVWHYLTVRFMSQLFMIFTTATLVIFLATTVSFTYLLVNNIKNSTLNNLATTASVLSYAVDSKKTESLANTETIAESPAVATAVADNDHQSLVSLTSTYLADKKQSSLIIVNDDGQVLLRAEDPSRWGDSLSSDTLLLRAIVGQSVTSVSSSEGVLAPIIYIRSAVPIMNTSNQIVGVAIGSLQIDNAFVDGIKNATGLDSSVYAGNILTATTFLNPDGITRSIGTLERNTNIENTVLSNGQNYKGTESILNRQYSVVYVPLKDADNNVIGMLSVNQPQDQILKTAGRSIELTYIIAALLLVVSVVPAFLIARSIAKQVN